MKLNWPCKIPELADMPAEKQNEVLEKCIGKHWRYWQTWFAALVTCACVASGSIVGMKYDSIFLKFSCLIIGCIIGAWIWTEVHVWITRVHIREYLSSHA
jgi:uncharacterized membrane protein AbrB (regulator of aidB expression)